MTTRRWNGGGNDRASNPDNWLPTGAPQPGDSLWMNGGSNGPMLDEPFSAFPSSTQAVHR
jgi:hypothetical protein